MIKSLLFREEAIAHVKHHQMGSVFMNIPLRFTMLAVGGCLLVMGLMLFALFADFSETYSVTGFITAASGVAHIYPSHHGVVRLIHVEQGARVKQGDPLFVLDISAHEFGTSLSQDVFGVLNKRKKALKTLLLAKRRYVHALQPLVRQKYITSNDYQAKQDDIVALENQIHELDIQLIRETQSRTEVIRAPMDGVISNLIVHVGQDVSSSKPLLSMVAHDATLVGQLYVPVAKAGFISVQDPIVIHYDAYPYQRFGSARGRIDSLSQSVLTDEMDDKPIQIGQAYYKARAKLDHQTMMVYGKPRVLQQGMTFTAVVSGPSKKVWQWIFDPVYHGGV